MLRKHGIKVNIGVLKNESHEINKGFFSRFQNNRPYISAKSGISLDGKIALHNNQSKWITSNLSRENVQIERALSSAILTTSNTILSDNPKLTVRDSSLLRKIKQQPTIKESLLDELILYISPKILGHSSKTFSGINSIKKLSQKINFKINDIIEISHDLKLRLSRI